MTMVAGLCFSVTNLLCLWVSYVWTVFSHRVKPSIVYIKGHLGLVMSNILWLPETRFLSIKGVSHSCTLNLFAFVHLCQQVRGSNAMHCSSTLTKPQAVQSTTTCVGNALCVFLTCIIHVAAAQHVTEQIGPVIVNMSPTLQLIYSSWASQSELDRPACQQKAFFSRCGSTHNVSCLQCLSCVAW